MDLSGKMTYYQAGATDPFKIIENGTLSGTKKITTYNTDRSYTIEDHTPEGK